MLYKKGGKSVKKVYIETNGCAVLRHETYKIAMAFEKNEYEETSDIQEANVVIMTGCAVIDSNERYALEAIKRINTQRNKYSTFIVSGCLPAICGEKVRQISSDIILLKYGEISKIDEIFSFKTSINDVYFNCEPKRHHSFGDPEIVVQESEQQDEWLVRKIDDACKNTKAYNQFVYSTRGRHLWREKDLFEIRVSYGCANRCSYCATKIAIGDFVSVPLKKILEQVELASQKGYKRIMLMGDEIGYWNDGGYNIVDLVSAIENLDASIRIGIRYISPDIIVKYYRHLEEHFASGRIYYFCSAFQSGSSRILTLMNRNPNITPFINCMKDIEDNRYPVMKHTQIIVGFPTETAEDVMDTLDCLQQAAFDHVTITKYCPRKGTKAYEYDCLTDDVVDKRVRVFENWLLINRNSKLYNAVKQEVINTHDQI